MRQASLRLTIATSARPLEGAVHDEMLALQVQLLENLRDQLRRQGRLAGSELDRAEIAHLRQQVNSFERRLAGWKPGFRLA